MLHSIECVDTLEYADALQDYFDKCTPYGIVWRLGGGGGGGDHVWAAC
jgi:hypothetical protein